MSKLTNAHVTERDPDWFASNEPLTALRRAWNMSRDTVQAIRDRLASTELATEIVTIAVSGSLGRMEQISSSDADLIVVVNESPSSDRRQSPPQCRYVAQVWDAIASLNLPRPESVGVFSEAVDQSLLTTTTTAGKIDEEINVFGKRIQLLLDSQPVYADLHFDRLRYNILARYASGDVGIEPRSEWTYLVNDLVRYFRCLALNNQWKPRAPGTKPIFEAKFAHSRRTLYVALLLLLGESSRHGEAKFSWVERRLGLTPLERISEVISAGDANSSNRQLTNLLTRYDLFLERMETLNTAASNSTGPTNSDELAQLKSNGDELGFELASILSECSRRWSRQMQQLLMF